MQQNKIYNILIPIKINQASKENTIKKIRPTMKGEIINENIYKNDRDDKLSR